MQLEIPLQPWLIPLVVMAAIAIGVGASSLVVLLRDRPLAKGKVVDYLRIAVLIGIAGLLTYGAFAILIYVDGVAEKWIGIATFVPAAASAILAIDALFKVLSGRRDSYASRFRNWIARAELESGKSN